MRPSDLQVGATNQTQKEFLFNLNSKKTFMKIYYGIKVYGLGLSLFPEIVQWKITRTSTSGKSRRNIRGLFDISLIILSIF